MVLMNVKTTYSLLSSLCDIKKTIKKAKEYGYTSVAIADINNMYGVIEFYKECEKQNIKPIIGFELIFNNINLLLYAKNNEGYKNLLKIVTLLRTDQLTEEDLKKCSKNIIAIGEKHNIFETEIEFKEIYHEEVLYINREDQVYLDYAYAIRDGVKYEDERIRAPKNKHIKKPEEIEIENLDLIEKCNVEIKETKDLLPKLVNEKEYEYLTSLCKEGLKKRMHNQVTKEYTSRLIHELEIIKEMGFCGYFLVVYDFIKYSKQNGILVGPARGSAGGSLVSYCLGITDIDPIKHNLIFERFLNPERITMPDIDIDFASDKREKVIEYVTKKHGVDKVAQIITFGTMKARAVIRDVGRVMDIELKLIDKICKIIDPRMSLKDSYETNKELKNLIDSSSILQELFKISMHLEGLPRHTSLHAAGVVISNKPLIEVVPLDKGMGNTLTTQYSMEYLEELGLLKMDFLGLGNLTTIQHIIDDIKKDDSKFNYNDIPLNDEKTIKIFKDVNVEGIFQFESPGMRRFLEKLKVDSFENIVAAIALYRPGPMDNIDLYIRRKEGKENIDYFHPDLENILKDTYGVIVYQEQIMKIANVMAGYSLGESDVLRRAMSKKKQDVMAKEKDKFIEGSIKRGYKKDVSEKVFNLISKFAGYGFNRAHSVAYAIISYNLAYFKAHYPSHFIKNLLNSVIGNEKKTREYIDEAKRNNIDIKKPNINISNYGSRSNKNEIILGLGLIKNVGSAAVGKIIEVRKEKVFTDFFDFVSRTYGKAVTKGVIESLIDAGALRDFNLNKKTLHFNIEQAINYAELTGGEQSLFEVEKPLIEKQLEFDSKILREKELKVMGFSIGTHPINKYRNFKNTTPIKEVSKNIGKTINVVGFIDKKKEISTKNNEQMAFLTLSDEIDKVDTVLFPKIYEQYKNIEQGDIVLIKGRVERRLSNYQIVIEKLKSVK